MSGAYEQNQAAEIKRLRDEFLEKMMPAAKFIRNEIHCDVLPSGDYQPNGSGFFRVRTRGPIDNAAFDSMQEKLKFVFGEQNVKVFAEPDVERFPLASTRDAAFYLTGSVEHLVQKAQQLKV